jgi:hypothetical protein
MGTSVIAVVVFERQQLMHPSSVTNANADAPVVFGSDVGGELASFCAG